MAVDIGTELRRPLPLALLVLAVIGWIVALYEMSSLSSLRAADADRINALTSELNQQRQASGTLADIQQKIQAAQGEVAKANQDRDQAQAQLADTQKNFDAAKQQLAETSKQLDEQKQQLAQ